MKKMIIAGVSALCLLAACGVDKDGTGDNLVKNIEEQAGVELTSEQKSCVKDVVNDLSDDEIKAISDNKASAEEQEAFASSWLACISDALTPIDTTGS